MSAAKMVADSTQADVPEMSCTKKRKKMVQKKKVKKKKEKESSRKTKKKSPEIEFDESDLDLEKEVHPIGFFIKDKEGLLEQMFHCVKGPSLERTLPDVLQDLPMDELKQRCLQQLLVMSKKRIRRILAGDDPSTISSSGTEDETSEEEVQVMDDEEENDGDEAHVVDSTSLYEQAADNSDRHLDDDGDSMVHSSMSPYLSDVEQNYQCQYEEDSEQEYQSGNDYTNFMEIETTCRHPVVVKEPEDPEEGEVFDDSDGNEPASNIETVTDVREVFAIDADTKDDSDVVNMLEGAERDVAETSTGVDAKIDSVAKKESDMKVEGIKTCEEGETNENCNVITDNKTVNDDESVVIEKSGELPTRKQGVNVEENVPEISIDDVDDEQFVDETGEKSESGQSDGEITEEENTQPEKREVKISEGTSSDSVQNSQPPCRIVKPPSQDLAPALTRNQMELLELEMRARAIKAMLKSAR